MLSKKRDWTLPATKKELYDCLHSDYTIMPKKVIKEMYELDYVHRSPYSISFYNKRKDWDYTEKDTIRWSNHWNFYSRKTGNKLHAKTNIEVPNDTWARGKYDINSDTFIIEEIYENILFYKEEYLIFKEEIKNTIVNFKNKYSEDIIERGRIFSFKIKEGKVKCNCNGILKVVKKFNKLRIDLEDNSILDRRIFSEKGKNPDKLFKSFTERYPDFYLLIDNIEYNEERLKEEFVNNI